MRHNSVAWQSYSSAGRDAIISHSIVNKCQHGKAYRVFPPLQCEMLVETGGPLILRKKPKASVLPEKHRQKKQGYSG